MELNPDIVEIIKDQMKSQLGNDWEIGQETTIANIDEKGRVKTKLFACNKNDSLQRFFSSTYHIQYGSDITVNQQVALMVGEINTEIKRIKGNS